MKSSSIKTILSLFYFICSSTFACYNSSTEMYRCLHLFLERDFYLVQDLFNFQPKDFRQVRFRLDQMELTQLCENIKEMEYCYQSQLPSCFTFPFHLNLLRIMNSLHGVHEILCGNGTDNLKELITHGYCIENYRKINPTCNHEFNFNYPLVFLKIARFQANKNVCLPLIRFRKCMIDPLMNKCDRNAMTIWNQTMDTVIRGFCYRQQYINCSTCLKLNFYLFILFFVFPFLINFNKV